MIDVMSFGGGVQSTAIMTLAGEGRIPMPEHWVFADPGFEGADTYAHLERCREYLAKRGATLDLVSAGNLRDDAILFAERRQNKDVSRYASIPMFIEKRDGTDGILPRQCTSEYKLEPIEEFHRRRVLKLKPRGHAPKTAEVNVWIGISTDEPHRAKPPGQWKEVKDELGVDLFGEPIIVKSRMWKPDLWQVKTFPLMGFRYWPDREREDDPRFEFCSDWDRDDCKDWLAKLWTWPVPRSACICCPYRRNDEWLDMRENRPDDWAQAVEFDKRIREGYAAGQAARGELAGVPYLHRSRVALDLVDLSVPMNDRMGCGGLFSQEPDGICGV